MQLGKWSVLIIFAGYYCGCSDQRQSDHHLPAPVPVKVMTAKTFDSHQLLAYSGTMEALEATPLGFAAMGTVARVFVQEGDPVRKGQLLAELNDESSRNAYEIALASLKQAEDAYNRLLPMYRNGNLAEIKWIEIETNLQKAKSAAAISKKNLDDCKLYATVTGVVGKRSMEPGMAAMPNLASLTIVKIDQVLAKISVSEDEISPISKGQSAKIKIGALANRTFNGRVEEIGVVADALAHTYTVKIRLPNPGQKIKPGMICTVTLENKSEIRSLVVPGDAVMVDETGCHYLYVVGDQNRAVRKEVTIGALLQDGIEITAGLGGDEQVVVSGQHKLVEQTPLQIINR